MYSRHRSCLQHLYHQAMWWCQLRTWHRRYQHHSHRQDQRCAKVETIFNGSTTITISDDATNVIITNDSSSTGTSKDFSTDAFAYYTTAKRRVPAIYFIEGDILHLRTGFRNISEETLVWGSRFIDTDTADGMTLSVNVTFKEFAISSDGCVVAPSFTNT